MSLKAQDREILGKKVKKLRRDGFIPAHVFGKKVETEHVSVKAVDFSQVFSQAGETGLIDLKIGDSKVRPVLVRDIQVDPVRGATLHIDFYQVNLAEKVKVFVPIRIVGEDPEVVKMGEAVVIQPIGEVEVEALPAELPDHLEVDITTLQAIDDAITISQMQIPTGVELMADPEAVVVKLDTAVSEEAQQLMEEQEAEAAAVAETAETEEGAEAPAEGHGPEGAEGEEKPEGEEKAEGSDKSSEDKAAE